MQASAQIIPFPSQTRASPDGQERLVRALASLDAALAEQRAAMDRFRLTLGDLGRAIGGVGTSLVDYGDELACLHHDVEQLGTEARALEAWADQAIAKDAPLPQ